MDKIEVLKNAKTQREQEVFEYQINIDNYRIAIGMMEAKSPAEREPLKGFEAQLRELLRSNLLEQSKAQIMLDAINAQLV